MGCNVEVIAALLYEKSSGLDDLSFSSPPCFFFNLQKEKERDSRRRSFHIVSMLSPTLYSFLPQTAVLFYPLDRCNFLLEVNSNRVRLYMTLISCPATSES